MIESTNVGERKIMYKNDYWYPCNDCRDKYCSSCIITKQEKRIGEEANKREAAEIRIHDELEPRLAQEARAYDFYITTDKDAEICESFVCKIDDLIKAVEDSETAFDWECAEGDIEEKILYLIKEEIKNKRSK